MNERTPDNLNRELAREQDRLSMLDGERARTREKIAALRAELEAKSRALEGVLVPVTARWNEDMLRAAGFAQVDCVWRCMNFAAWLAVKD